MADINGVKLSAGSGPTVNYTITYTKSRPSNTQMTYNFSISCALGSSSSYIGSGYALLCTMTVNGSSSQVRIKANDNDNWSGTAPRVKTVSVTCSSTTGNAAQTVNFKVVSDGRLTLSSSGIINNSGYTVLSGALLSTAPTAPTSVSITPSIFESTGAGMTIKWSGASGGVNNAITGYQIYNYVSTDNINWTNPTNWSVENVTSVQAAGSSIPRGSYFRARIIAKGSTQNSGFSPYSNSVRHNTAPTQPSTVTASPANYSTENITVSWSGASSGTSAIKGFMIASRTSTNNSTWSSWNVLSTLMLSATSGSYTDTNPSRTPGTYTQYGVWTIDALNVYSSETISNSIQCNVTACGAPTAFSVSSTIAEGNVTLSWSGATGGAGNPIASYEIQYSESGDNSTWGSWYALTTITSTAVSGTLSVAPSSTRGNYRRFQIRTRGTAGTSYYSAWRISSNSVRKNILPEAPTSFTVSPTVYAEPSVYLSWSGVVPGTSAIRQYVIQQSTSTDNANWSSWENVAAVVTVLTYGSYTATPSNIAGMYTRYRIAVTDVLNALSAYVISDTIQKNRPPFAPILTAPQNESITYNRRPMVLIQTRADPDGHPQTIYVHTAAGYWVNNVDHPEYFSRGGSTVEGVKTIFTAPEVAPGRISIEAQCRDEYSAGMSAVRTFTILPPPFEDIIANETQVKASHITTLRTAVNHVRNYYNLPNYIWSREIIPGRTQVRDWPFHILELRAALQGVVDVLNNFDSTSTTFDIPHFEWIPLETGRPRADVIRQLHDLVLML